MRILHISPSLKIETGGAIVSVRELASALYEGGIEVSIFAPSESSNDTSVSDIKGVKTRVFPRGILSGLWTGHSPLLAKAVKEAIVNFDLIHIHEIWHHAHFAAYQAAKSARKPFIVTLHGELEPWRLNYKAFRKKIYFNLIQKRILREAAALHAITKGEVEQISKFINNKNIFYIPNGLNVNEFENLPSRKRCENLYPEIQGKKVILFLGRIHPMKGLDILAKAFGNILKRRRDIQLVIAGPDNNGYRNRIVEILKDENAICNTTFTGMVKGENKLALLGRADIFVLPSYSEVLGLSTLEAMACSIPVIITTACHFPEVKEKGAGEVVDVDVGQLSKTLNRFLDDPQLCKEMGKKGKALVRERYTWDRVADAMIAAYKRIIDRKN